MESGGVGVGRLGSEGWGRGVELEGGSEGLRLGRVEGVGSGGWSWFEITLKVL